MKLLAIETATEACSVALLIDGEVIERFEIAPRRHTELVLPWADALLAEAGIGKSQLDAIACGRGPGAFTGVRLAVALTQGLGFALDRSVLGVSTLAALAFDARESGGDAIVAAIDARMGEIYLGEFARDDAQGVRAIGVERLLDPRVADVASQRFTGVGTGFDAEQGALRAVVSSRAASIDASALPHAAAVARLAALAFARGEAIAPERLEPAYLRDKVALTLAEQKASAKPATS
jgi:tRNA threonylcarbamoyladenosine biosynthesis protein TsaB